MQMSDQLEFSVSQFVEIVNQTFTYAFSNVVIYGELANFVINKNQWVYFDLKDDVSSIKCFGAVYSLSSPLKDGMILKVFGSPKLHSKYGFSFNFLRIQPVGEGSIKKAQKLLEDKLAKEGLFDISRKRNLPYPPKHIGLITSEQSAAYTDFIKILNERWRGLLIEFIDVQVQGDLAENAICNAIDHFNLAPNPPEILVITRGGGSSEDLWVFSTEKTTRAIAASRIPTLVAIGHEINTSLTEKAADLRASTPSNAAEIIVPNRKDVLINLGKTKAQLAQYISSNFIYINQMIENYRQSLDYEVKYILRTASNKLESLKDLLEILSPNNALKRGYAIIRHKTKLLRSGRILNKGDIIDINLIDAEIGAEIKKINIIS
jgi:exodeoxyribonuclease VII large subunit